MGVGATLTGQSCSIHGDKKKNYLTTNYAIMKNSTEVLFT